MTHRDCETVRDLLPGIISGSLPPEEAAAVEDHLNSCQDCREELEVVTSVREGLASDMAVPAGLEATIQARVREEMGRPARAKTQEPEGRGRRVRPAFGRRPWARAWVLSAAAVGILALGTSLLWNGGGPAVDPDLLEVASQDLPPEAWLWDDGMIAGAPVFDGLSEEELESLLEELEG
jgi:anti-sigma factor RsiW